MSIGPVQLLVVGFDDPDDSGKIRAELDRLRSGDVIRLLDLLVIQKHDDGTVERHLTSDLSEEEAEEVGAIAGALIGVGFGGEEGAEAGAVLGADAAEGGHLLGDVESWYVDDAIPEGSAAAVALFEHRWAIPLRDAIRDAGGFLLADAWVHPTDLVAVGVIAAEEAAVS
jgi:uncharacterized membrane protein